MSSSSGPLGMDPECAQFSALIIKQSRDRDFGFSRAQIQNLNSSIEGKKLWDTVQESYRGSKFDFGKFARTVAPEDMKTLKQCISRAREMYPSSDPRDFCVLEVWDLCKKLEHTWTNFVFHTQPKIS
jgi:hypothetical protein